MALEDDDNIDLFTSDEEEDGEENENEVGELYENKHKADSWQALSWDLDAIHRSDEAIIANMNLLGSDDHTHNSVDKIKKELSEDDKICLEIHSVASLERQMMLMQYMWTTLNPMA